jgi:membrane protein DedA with SNARE-associated domain
MELADVMVWLERWGLLALLVLMALENLNLPLPSEPILLYAGFMVANGDATFIEVVGAAAAGTLLGASGSYLLGHRGRWLLDRHGRWVGATPRRVDAAHAWMERYGDKAVLYGRVVPLVRTFVSVTAGAARMHFGRFLVLTMIGSTVWTLFLVTTGYLLDDAWSSAERWLGPLKFVLLGGFCAVVFALALRWWLRRNRETAAARLDAPE